MIQIYNNFQKKKFSDSSLLRTFHLVMGLKNYFESFLINNYLLS
jgi:hypothetical protein